MHHFKCTLYTYDLPLSCCSDHRLNDFPGYDHSAWIYKRQKDMKMREKVKASGKEMKIVAVYPSLFLESAIIVRIMFLS